MGEDAAWDGDAAVSPDGRLVAFVSDRGDGGRDVFLRPAKGGEARLLADVTGDASRPSWSRDGRRLLFTLRDPATGRGTAVVAEVAAGSNAPVEARPLGIPGDDVRDAAFSPDGQRVAFVAHSDTADALVEARLADFHLRTLYAVQGGAATGAPEHPTWAVDGSGVVFAWKGDLWWANGAAGPALQLTSTTARESEPALSPNGKWLAFVSDSTGTPNVWIARFDATKGTLTTAWRPVSASFQPHGHPAWGARSNELWFDRQEPWVIAVRTVGADQSETLSSSLFDSREPSFSGDGSQVVFSSPRNGSWGLWVMHAEGEVKGGPAKEAGGPGTRNDRDPNWSKASGWVAASRAFDQGRVIVAFDPAEPGVGGRLTGPDTAATSPSAWTSHDRAPAWSADGRSLAFVSDRDGADAVWLMQGVSRVLRRVAAGTDPAWWPDGASVVFQSANDRSLWRTNPEGAPQRLTADTVEGAADGRPSVTRDGQRIVFTRQQHGDRDLWMLDVATGEATPLVVDPRAADDHADWTPDGRRVVYETGGAVNLCRADVRPLLLR